MPLYNCQICGYSTKQKNDYNRHLNTKKHRRNMELIQKNKEIDGVMTPNDHLVTPNDHFLTLNDHFSTPNDHFGVKNDPDKKDENPFICEYCEKSFTTYPHLKRHQKKSCNILKSNNENVILKSKLVEQQLINFKLEKEKTDLYRQIEKLLDKVGNTTINQTQNIILNNYGKEDLSHITDNLKSDLLKIPYGAIPKLIEQVHFNDNKPENKNIALTNKKDNKVKIFSGDKWIYKDKEDTIHNLVNGKYNLLDSHYEKNQNNLQISCQENFSKFKNFFDENDKNLLDQLKKECELVLLNNR
jgi:hypothetical protein